MNKSIYDVIKKAFNELPDSVHKHYLPYPPEKLMDRFRWLLACGSIFCPDYKFKWPQLDWWQDDKFNSYLQSFGESQGMNSDRRWNMLQFLKQTEDVLGDTAECGAYTGASSYLICQQNLGSKKNRMHHIFDSFEGLSEPGPLDGTHWEKHALKATKDELVENLKSFSDRYKTYRGWIPERFSDVTDKTFCFVHIDVDLYEPTLESFRFFYPRLNSGGIIVCDDYGFGTCPGCTKAVTEFMNGKPETVIYPASGGCILIKK